MSSLMILSFSTLESDPRVQRQIALFAERYDVTTVGFGPRPHPGVEHVEIPQGTRAWPSSKQHLLTGRYRGAYWSMSAVAAAHELLAEHVGTMDAVLANDVNTLPLALWLSPRRGVHADLHEYAPREKEHQLAWRTFVAPYQRWLCRTCLPEVASVTTVSPGLAREYAARFGVDVEVVTNASAHRDLPVRPTAAPIRLLHTGVARANRHLEAMVEAVRGLEGAVTLDLMLMPSEPGYIEHLRQLAAEVPGAALRDPVPYARLVDTVAEYDVSLVVFPNSTFNLEHSLPNKLYEAVQGRTGVIVGPSPDMADLVREHSLGAVLPAATAEAMHTELAALTPSRVDAWKRAADASAQALSAERQVLTWQAALERILDRA